MSIGIEIEGLAELRAALEAADSTLTRSLDEAVADAGELVAGRVRQIAPRRSGRMRDSTRAFTEGGTVGGVEVTARRVSARYPGGFAYPRRVDQRTGFMGRAVADESTRVMARFEEVLDDISRAWGG